MIHDIFRTYKKLIIFSLFVLCVLVFVFFEYRRNDRTAANEDQWELVESESRGQYYTFETELLKGTLEYGFQGYTAADEILPVTVKASCKEDKFDGIIRISVPGTNGKGIAYQAALNCEKGVLKKKVLEIPQLGNTSCFVFEILDQFGVVQFSRTVELSSAVTENGETKLYVGVLSDSFPSFSYMKELHFHTDNAEYMTELVELKKSSFPTDPRYLSTFSVIVMDAFHSEELTSLQLDCLYQWTKDGGQFILCGGVQSEDVLAAFSEKLGISAGRTYQKKLSVNDETSYLNQLTVYFTEWKFSNQSSWVSSEWSEPVSLYRKTMEEGSVNVLTFSLIDNSFMQWMGRDQALTSLFTYVSSDTEEKKYETDLMEWYVKKAIYSFLDSQTPSTFYYGFFFILYLAMVCCVAYYLLKQIKRREWIWVVVPGISVFFTALLMVGAIRTPEDTNNLFSALKIKDEEKREEVVYLLCQNKDGKSKSIDLLSSYNIVEPLDYEYGELSSKANGLPVDYTVNDAANGMEIVMEESVPGSSQLMKISKSKKEEDSADSTNFKVQIKGDYTRFRGTIENVSGYDYRCVLLVRGTQYTVLYDLKKGEKQNIKGSDVKSWTLVNGEQDFEDNSQEGVLNNLLSYLEYEYISTDNKLNQLLAIGITNQKTIELFDDKTELKNQITVDVNRYKISTDNTYDSLITDINRQCLVEADGKESLEEDILEENQTEALYKFNMADNIGMLIRNSDSFEGLIFAYNHKTDKMEMILSKPDDVLEDDRLKNFISEKGEMKLRYVLPEEEIYGSAPVISLLYNK